MKKPYNIIFAGTPEFAASILNALIRSSHNIKAVYTQPDRPAGRGRKLTPSAVKEVALQHELPVFQPENLKNSDDQKILADLQADLMIVVAYGLILPTAVLQAPSLGCINVHASLLPRWRGAAPIQRAILANDEKTGVTIMQMDAGLDTGAMLYKAECKIEKTDTSESLHDKLASLGAEALLTTLENLPTIHPESQNNAEATYAHKIKKEEAQINWHASADEIDRQVRAYNPWPVAFYGKVEHAVRIWKSTVLSQEKTHAEPGTIIRAASDGIDVATGHGVLRLLTLQLPGGRALSVADILNARAADFAVGTIVG